MEAGLKGQAAVQVAVPMCSTSIKSEDEEKKPVKHPQKLTQTAARCQKH